MTNDTMHLGFSTLDNLRVTYSYEACDGEYWCEITEVYRGDDPLNLMPYLSDDVLAALEKQVVWAQATD